MTHSVRTIPNGLKARDFLVYSLRTKEEGYFVRPSMPTLVGQLKEIDVSSSGYTRYSMIRLVPRSIDELFENDYGVPKSPLPARHKHGDHDIVTPRNYILVGKTIPRGWFCVRLNPVLEVVAVKKAIREATHVAMSNWFPYRPNTKTRSRHPWAFAFESETDAIAFQAHMTANS